MITKTDATMKFVKSDLGKTYSVSWFEVEYLGEKHATLMIKHRGHGSSAEPLEVRVEIHDITDYVPEIDSLVHFQTCLMLSVELERHRLGDRVVPLYMESFVKDKPFPVYRVERRVDPEKSAA